jgi:hypothetical protein
MSTPKYLYMRAISALKFWLIHVILCRRTTNIPSDKGVYILSVYKANQFLITEFLNPVRFSVDQLQTQARFSPTGSVTIFVCKHEDTQNQ